MIRFTETRTLLDGTTVAAGAEKEFSPAEESAFVANGVAVYLEPDSKTPATGKTKKEVADHE